MAEASDERGILLQNLRDAGCDRELIQRCMELAEHTDAAGILPLLRKYRGTLLGKVHKSQNELDCLDFLIYKLKNSRREKTLPTIFHASHVSAQNTGTKCS